MAGHLEDTGAERESFAGADLRGVSFEGASLAGANLSGAQTGMRTRWKLVLVGVALLVSIALGVATGLGTKSLRSLLESGEPRKVSLALNAFAALLVLIVAGIWKGGDFALRNVLPVIAAMVVAAALIAIVTGVGSGAGAVAVLGVVLLGLAVVGLGAIVRAVAGTVATATFAVVAIAGGLAGGFVGGGLAAVIIAVSAMLIGRRTLRATAKYPRMSRWCVEIACKRGTRFRDADLSGADFSRADLTACDFRGANLRGARIEDAAQMRMCLFDGGRDTPPASQLGDDRGGS